MKRSRVIDACTFNVFMILFNYILIQGYSDGIDILKIKLVINTPIEFTFHLKNILAIITATVDFWVLISRIDLIVNLNELQFLSLYNIEYQF